jgi:hypothetical protein
LWPVNVALLKLGRSQRPIGDLLRVPLAPHPMQALADGQAVLSGSIGERYRLLYPLFPGFNRS